MVCNQNEQESFKLLEESLWLQSTRFDQSYMNDILHDDFFEFGRSGRVYSKQECLSASLQDICAKIPLENFKVHHIANDVVLITYISEVGHEQLRANRSSLWVKKEHGWKLQFHQGTPCS